MINKAYLGLLLGIFFSVNSINPAAGQEAERAQIRPIQFYLGIQPGLTVEPFDEYRNSVDLNLVPLILEYSLNTHFSIKLTPLVNLQLRPEFPAALSNLGAGITLPYHFSKKNSEEGHRGFYAGPNLALSKHLLDDLSYTTLAAEFGYAFIFNRILSVTVGAQAGTTITRPSDSGYRRILPHSGAIFSFGFWF